MSSAVKCSINLKQTLHALSVSKTQDLFAVAGKSDVKILRLDAMGITQLHLVQMTHHSQDSFMTVLSYGCQIFQN
jgi:hypothetical protein